MKTPLLNDNIVVILLHRYYYKSQITSISTQSKAFNQTSNIPKNHILSVGTSTYIRRKNKCNHQSIQTYNKVYICRNVLYNKHIILFVTRDIPFSSIAYKYHEMIVLMPNKSNTLFYIHAIIFHKHNLYDIYIK